MYLWLLIASFYLQFYKSKYTIEIVKLGNQNTIILNSLFRMFTIVADIQFAFTLLEEIEQWKVLIYSNFSIIVSADFSFSQKLDGPFYSETETVANLNCSLGHQTTNYYY